MVDRELGRIAEIDRHSHCGLAVHQQHERVHHIVDKAEAAALRSIAGDRDVAAAEARRSRLRAPSTLVSIVRSGSAW